MSIVIEILDASGNKVTQLDEKECTIKTNRIINGEWSVEINYPIPPSGQGEDKSNYLRGWLYRARIIDTNQNTLYNYYTYNYIFVLTKFVITKNENNILFLIFSGEHLSLFQLNSYVLKNDIIAINYTTANIIRLALATAGITTELWADVDVDTEYNNKMDITINAGETALSALYQIIGVSGGELNFDYIHRIIKITTLGADNNVKIKQDINLKSLINTQYSRKAINVIYGFGGGQPITTIANARHEIYSYNLVTGVIRPIGFKVVPENDSWNTDYEVYFVTGAEKGNAFTITDSARLTYWDTLTIATGRSIALGDKFIIRTVSDNLSVKYIRAGVSIVTYGQLEGSYKNQKYTGTINLVDINPALDGTYTDGRCEGWAKEGTCTLTENTTTAYIQYGTKSQKVVADADGEGISQVISTVANNYYTLSVWVYMYSGSVKVRILDGANYTDITKDSSCTGWQEFVYSEQILNTSIQIYILQSGAGASTFYIDAVQVEDGTEKHAFTGNTELKQLWDEAFSELMISKEPLIEYVCKNIDLYLIDKSKYSNYQISLGDTIHLTDNDLGISDVSLRVKQIQKLEFQPELTEHTISNGV